MFLSYYCLGQDSRKGTGILQPGAPLFFQWLVIADGVYPTVELAKCRMRMPEQSGDSFDLCVFFRLYFIWRGAALRRGNGNKKSLKEALKPLSGR